MCYAISVWKYTISWMRLHQISSKWVKLLWHEVWVEEGNSFIPCLIYIFMFIGDLIVVTHCLHLLHTQSSLTEEGGKETPKTNKNKISKIQMLQSGDSIKVFLVSVSVSAAQGVFLLWCNYCHSIIDFMTAAKANKTSNELQMLLPDLSIPQPQEVLPYILWNEATHRT